MGQVWASLSPRKEFVKGIHCLQAYSSLMIGWYEEVSGQQINIDKSGFLVHDKRSSRCVARVRQVTGFVLKSLLVRYLGCPLFSGRRKSGYSMDLVQSVIDKISAWRSRCLSFGGRIILIKHVLSAILTHLLTWNLNMLRSWVPDSIVEEIVRKPVPMGFGQDNAIRCLTESGDFSLASTYPISGGQRPTSFMFDRVWHPLLPIKIAFFMIRVLRDRLLLASSLGRLNVHGPSKCFCCTEFQSESLDHIFSKGDLAQFLWRFFGHAVGVVFREAGVRSRLADVVGLFGGQCAGGPDGVVRWEMPSTGICKLNTDGCSLGNPGISGGGGVLRDSSGSLIFGFSIPLGELISLQTETRSLLYGVQQCLSRGFSRVQVEVDSLLLVNILRGKSRCPWRVRSKIESIQTVLRMGWSVEHCYREANQVADALSKVGALGSGIVIYTSQSALPRPARGAMVLDSTGTPVLCIRAMRS
ncbi:uncharacterized protein [Coffea arabica]|uniref:RNase H type-1 domain-containing protein n=1 Tax=Coffea arabica TaxID=13443 RepID=A0ABM4WQ27_COFAR